MVDKRAHVKIYCVINDSSDLLIKLLNFEDRIVSTYTSYTYLAVLRVVVVDICRRVGAESLDVRVFVEGVTLTPALETSLTLYTRLVTLGYGDKLKKNRLHVQYWSYSYRYHLWIH